MLVQPIPAHELDRSVHLQTEFRHGGVAETFRMHGAWGRKRSAGGCQGGRDRSRGRTCLVHQHRGAKMRTVPKCLSQGKLGFW